MADTTLNTPDEIPSGVSRRQFIKGVIAGGAVVSAAGYLLSTVPLLSQNGGAVERLITLRVNGQQRRVDVLPCAAASCREDDGRPVEVGCQEPASNHPKRLS